MTAKRFTVDSDGEYWDRESNKYVTIDHLFYLVEKLEKENEQLKKDIEYYKTERLVLFEYLDKKDDLKLKLKVEESRTVKIDRYEIFNNGAEYKRIYDYLKGENIVFLSTDNKELNIVLAEVVLKQLNQME